MVCMILRPWEKRNCCLSAALSAFLPLHTATSNCWVCQAKKIGDDAIDDVFETVSAAIGDTVWEKFGEFIVRQHLDDELFDRIKRDMAWACVEKVLDTPVFLPYWQKSIRKGIFRVHGTGNILPAGWLYCSRRDDNYGVASIIYESDNISILN